MSADRYTCRLVVVFASAMLLLCSCAPSVSYRSVRAGLEPKSGTEEVLVFTEFEEIPFSYEIIGNVSVGDAGLTLVCGYSDVIEVAKKRAREAGGDAIKLTSVTNPDLWSSCYRISAAVLLLGDSTE